MDPRLLDYYNAELVYMRELAQEFADQHPKIATRLGINGIDVADPYVERLLQGFSFLTAQVQLKMDEQFPNFSQRMLEPFHSHYLAPTPPMAIAQFRPGVSEGSLKEGFHIPKHASMTSSVIKSERTTCEFRSAHDITLWPLEIIEMSCSGAPPDLPLGGRYPDRPVKGAIRIRIKTTNGSALNQLSLDELTFHLAGSADIASQLYENIFAHALDVVACEPKRPATWTVFMPPASIRAEGFDSNQSLIPVESAAFQPYRLLYEYFAFPARFHFFTLTGLRACMSKTQGDTLDFFILLDCPVPALENAVDKTQLALFCTPIVNLFSKQSAVVEIEPRQNRIPIFVDKRKLQDFEVYAISATFGHEKEEGGQVQKFYPFLSQSEANEQGSYLVHREPQSAADMIGAGAARGDYGGNHIHVSLVDKNQMPLTHSFVKLSAEMLCTNRNLASLIPLNGPTDFSIKGSAPLESIKLLRSPTTPKRPLAEGPLAWRVLNHLQFNHLTLTNTGDEEGPQALRDMLTVYERLFDQATKKQVEAIRHCRIKQIARRLPIQMSPLGYAVGSSIHITVDENQFYGTSPYLLGAILERLFPRHVGQHSFTETILHSIQRGEIGRWKPRIGQRPSV